MYSWKPDDFDPDRDDPEEEGKCSVVLGLMQEYRRLGKSQGLENLYLGVQMFKVKNILLSGIDWAAIGSHKWIFCLLTG